MSVIQSQQDEVRFLKRKNLDEEARIIGNYYADAIRLYGIDCVYHKLNTKQFENFKGIVDRNAVLMQAYGYNITPDYTLTAHMITYPEMQQDIFALQKYGVIPQADVDFNFDAKQFACDLATKCGQLKEYPIEETEIVCEVPDCHAEIVMQLDKTTGKEVEVLSASELDEHVFPYRLGLGYKDTYECCILKGRLSVEIQPYEYDKQYTVVCDPYEHTDFKVEFMKNSDLYKSLKYKICNDDYLETLIFLTFKVTKTKVNETEFRSVLSGKIHGSVLFYDVNQLGKYLEMIHPEVGDIVTIDFPDDKSREQYEITDCYDKSLQQDGISPLLHKYIWKCKARRHIQARNEVGLDENEANERLEEKLQHDQVVAEEVAKKVSFYDTLSGNVKEDAVYGGYDGTLTEYDHKKPDPQKHLQYDYLGDPTCLDIIRFACGSRLVTNGYDLIFVVAPSYNEMPGEGYVVSKMAHQPTVIDAYFESGLRWLKATDEKVVFVNIEGEATALAEDFEATQGEVQLCLNDLNIKTLDDIDINANGDNFVKFKGTRSYIWATPEHLFVKLQSNKQLYRLV